jgi:predicted Fe-Mo cluster-binding NifX family protein
MDAPIDPRFGRAQKFLLVETDSGEFQSIDNTQNVNAIQGAGIQAGQTAAQHGAQVVITGNCGPNAFRTLESAGIQVVVGAAGTVGDAIEGFKSGQLKPAKSSNVQGHWA